MARRYCDAAGSAAVDFGTWGRESTFWPGTASKAAHLQRSGRLVDVGGDIVEQTFVRISALGLQSNLDWDYLVDHVGDGHAALRHLGAHALHVPLVADRAWVP